MIDQKYSDSKIVWHSSKLEAMRKGEITAPIYVRVKPTNQCDHRCFYCSYDPQAGNVLSETIRRSDEISRDKILEILDDFGDMGVKAITYSGGGEPLVYPYIIDAFERTLGRGIDLSVITNGQRLNGDRANILSQAKWVRISTDACDAKVFSKIRRVREDFFYSLTDNIEDFARKKSNKCELGINFVINHLNVHQLYDAAKHFKGLGVNHIKFTPRVIDNREKWLKYHMPFKETVLEQITLARQELSGHGFDIKDTYEYDFNFSGVQERYYESCPIMQIIPVIGADSRVYFCHDKTYTNEGVLGSLKEQSFKTLWFSDEAIAKFKSFNPKNSCRHHCTYDSRNMLILGAINCYGEHVNFI